MTSSAPSHVKILSKRLSDSRRCTGLGSRSSPEFERTINRFPAKGNSGHGVRESRIRPLVDAVVSPKDLGVAVDKKQLACRSRGRHT